ncbi:pectinesterase [Marchantia polymorpha subsp. ruderalis]|uniref:Pectinesterase n=1 Tax=Marchantia polymorpha TaxID=3197 RepID=A0A2R6WVH7_MARPO|nr:hypothetical protein MARPO_0055s0109 [Marchantia polymorpha]BBN02934.1 hypothetical protein Mp_2g19430 [Marchantia polymorpha subsp. ruderalis]|eukprot:PTQ37858.1 hypothetical protein MARPO_0055s0109 [Marchantia polymorpha]
MRAQQVLAVCLLAAAAAAISFSIVDAATVAAKKVPQTDAEIEQEFQEWIGRMGEKQSSKVHVNGPKGVHYATANADSEVKYIVVDKSGKGDYKSVNKAIKAIPKDAKERYIVHVRAGTYKEHVKIPSGMGPITLQGEGHTKTKITYNLDATKAGGTLKSASVSVKSDNFIAKDIAFENSSPQPEPGAVGKQAVAFEISGDKAAFYRCAFYGFQDTLYDRYGRHYFKDCKIVGSIDYIFGNGQSYYETCELQSVAKTFGSLSAQKRMSAEEETGYSFVDCTVKGTGYLYLSRAWGPYSRVVFIRTYFDPIIRPEGWYNWGVPGREKTVFYGEYKCYGPGANRKDREYWSYALTDSQVAPFLTVDWVDGSDWIPRGPQ